jgi:hypothetical protein
MVLFSLPLETIAAELQNEGEGNEVLLEEEPNSSEKPVDALFIPWQRCAGRLG